jgi:ATP-dependent DNA ligase
MEQETMLKEILKALNLHSNHMDQKFKKIDERLDRIDGRLDRMEKKMDGFRVALTETQETVDFISAKTIQHEKKLRKLQQ